MQSQIFANFYSNLYAFSNPLQEEIAEFLRKAILFHLSTEHREWIDVPVLPEEIDTAIGYMSVNEPPEPDGFKIKFYKSYRTLAPRLGKIFVACITSEHILPFMVKGRQT